MMLCGRNITALSPFWGLLAGGSPRREPDSLDFRVSVVIQNTPPSRPASASFLSPALSPTTLSFLTVRAFAVYLLVEQCSLHAPYRVPLWRSLFCASVVWPLPLAVSTVSLSHCKITSCHTVFCKAAQAQSSQRHFQSLLDLFIVREPRQTILSNVL